MNDSIKREQSELDYSAERENLRPKGKKIINPWRNHEGYNCFGCSPDNPIGLHMEFYEDGDYIVSTWHPEHNYQGWVDTMHGGILSTLIDEVCGWVVTRKLQTSGYTVQLNVKFRKAVPTTEPELTIRAKVTKQVRNLAYISAEIINSKGELCNEGEAIYFLMNEEKAKEKNHGDGSPDHFFTQRSFILSWHTIIIVGAVADLHVWLCRLQARTYSEYSKLFKGE